MNLVDVQFLMAELTSGIEGARAEVGLTDRPRHNDAYLRLTSLYDPEVYAIVSTDGAGTYDLTVAGEFSIGMADDQALDPESVRGYLESYVRAALAYLDGHWSIRASTIFKVPILTIQNDVARLHLVSRGRVSLNTGPRF